MSATFSTLGDVAEFINGAAFKPEDWGGEGARIIRIQNLNDPTKPYNRTTRQIPERLHVHPSDILVSWSASLGVFEWQGPDVGLLNQHIFRVLPDQSKVDKRYLRYALELALLDMQKHLHGATMMHVNRGEFLATKFYLPSLAEQRHIAAILDQADSIRKKRREALAQLDNLTHSIFIEMFGDPARNLKGWPIFQLENLITDVTNGLTRRRKDNEEGSDIVLRLREIRAGWIDFSELNRITLAPNEAKRFLLSQGDLLFIRVNGNPDYVGRCAVFEGYSEPVYFNDHVMRVKIDHQQIHRAFLGFILNGPHGKQEIAKYRKTSAGQHTINQDGLGKIELPIPPIALQSEFANRLNSIGMQKLLLSKSLAELDIFFASLQHRAFLGEL